MSIFRSTPVLDILLAADDWGHLEAVANLLTHISWPPETVVHVLTLAPDRLPDRSPGPDEPQIDKELDLESWQHEADKILGEAANKLHSHHLVVKTEICEDQLPEAVLARSASADLSIDLIAVHPIKFEALVEVRLRDTAPQSAQQAHATSLLVARPSRQIRPLTTILVIDDSLEAWRAVEFMCILALPQWAKVTVVNVVKEQATIPDVPVPAKVQTLAGRGGVILDLLDPTTAAVVDRLHRCGTSVGINYRAGDPVNEILAIAQEQEADLIVIGACSQRQSQPFYLDDVAQEIIKSAPCSVLAIR